MQLDILPEEVALRYGYDVQPKLVSVILPRRFQAWVDNLSGAPAIQSDGEQGRRRAGRRRPDLHKHPLQ